jgi:hypothetical protein
MPAVISGLLEDGARPQRTSRAAAWPMKPLAEGVARPSLDKPRPLMWLWAAVLLSRALLFTSLTGTVAMVATARRQLVGRRSDCSSSRRFVSWGSRGQMRARGRVWLLKLQVLGLRD